MRHKILFADQLRSLAIISVLISHYFGIFWFDPALNRYINASEKLDIIAPQIIESINYIFIPNFAWGPFGVDIFFLISGFVIPLSLENTTRRDFVIKRFFRIYPTYFIGFSFIILMVALSSLFFKNPFPYSLYEIIIHSFVGLRDILDTKNIDLVIWTLELELKFYLLCLILFPLFQKKSTIIFIVPFILFIILLTINLIYSWNTSYPIPLLIYMFIGTVFYYNLKNKISIFYMMSLILSLLTLYIYIFYLLALPIIGFEYVKIISVSGIYALMIFYLSYIFRDKFRYNSIIAFISSISYPFYIIHSISGYIIIFILVKQGINPIIAITIAIIFLSSIAYLIHKFIEEPSIRFAKKLVYKI